MERPWRVLRCFFRSFCDLQEVGNILPCMVGDLSAKHCLHWGKKSPIVGILNNPCLDASDS
ncbi:MAG: hypothetical protein LBI18_13380 [Planctomycetaceae bacterium]|nr:hypothetical protein [Planctomycetaceae bacterium]